MKFLRLRGFTIPKLVSMFNEPRGTGILAHKRRRKIAIELKRRKYL